VSPWLSDLFLSSQSDERLVRLTHTGHHQAFGVIVQRYRRELLQFARRLCSDGRAEDVVQQAFLSAFAAIQNGTEVEHLRGWLYTIVRRQAARVRAHGAPDVDVSAIELGGLPLEEAVTQRMVALEALDEIKRLPENQRTAFIATALEGRQRSEVAGILGLSEGAVRQLVHRARSTVRAAVTAITPFPLLRWFTDRSNVSDWSVTEALAGAGGASTAAAAIKIGAAVVAGLGVASAIVVPRQLNHGHRARLHGARVSSARGAASGQSDSAGALSAARVALGATEAGASAPLAAHSPAPGLASVSAAPAVPAASALLTRHDGGRGGSDGNGFGRSDGGGSSGGDLGSTGSGKTGSDGGGSSGSDGGTSSSSGSGSDGVSGGSGGGGSSGSDGGTVSSATSSGSSGGGGGTTDGGGGTTDGGGGGSDGGSGSSAGTLTVTDGSSGGTTSGHDSSGG
jgi:RNA polymerase sigma factor (sigma-70 family)